MKNAKTIATIALWALPFAAVLVVIFAVFVVGAPRPYLGARVYGGPTLGVQRLALRLTVVERFVEVEQPAVLDDVEVQATAGGRRASWRGRLDDEGAAEVVLDLGVAARDGVGLTVSAGRTLAEGLVELRADEWARGAQRRGGWLRGQSRGTLVLRAAPERGAFAVPFAERLLVEVRDATGPVVGAELAFVPEGVNVGAGAITDSRGRARVLVTPLEHAVALGVEARAPTGATGGFYSTLPVVPGALRAVVEGGTLHVVSSVPRERAYFAVVTQSVRLGGGSVRLEPDGAGGGHAAVDVSRMLADSAGNDVWAVVSSEADLQSQATVGWPVRVAEQPARTFDVANRLLLDGMRLGFDQDMKRRQRARLLAGVFTLCSLLFVLVLMRFRVRMAEHELGEHLARAGASIEEVERARPRNTGLVLLVAALCLTLGFTVIALIAMLRIG